MILQNQRVLRRQGFVMGEFAVQRRPHGRLAIVQEDAVQEDGSVRGFRKLATCESRRLKNDVVAVPLSGRPDSVGQRRPLTVNRAGLSVGISGIVVRIQNLNLEFTHQKHTAVSAVLARPDDLGGRRPLNVELEIAEFFVGREVAGFGNYFEISIAYFPLGGSGSAAVFSGVPFR
jgi:hypothetical protein